MNSISILLLKKYLKYHNINYHKITINKILIKNYI